MNFFRLVGSAEAENLLCTSDHMRIAQFRQQLVARGEIYALNC